MNSFIQQYFSTSCSVGGFIAQWEIITLLKLWNLSPCCDKDYEGKIKAPDPVWRVGDGFLEKVMFELRREACAGVIVREAVGGGGQEWVRRAYQAKVWVCAKALRKEALWHFLGTKKGGWCGRAGRISQRCGQKCQETQASRDQGRILFFIPRVVEWIRLYCQWPHPGCLLAFLWTSWWVSLMVHNSSGVQFCSGWFMSLMSWLVG